VPEGDLEGLGLAGEGGPAAPDDPAVPADDAAVLADDPADEELARHLRKLQIAPGIGDADYGRIALAFLAILFLGPLIVGLVAYYVSEFGVLPFTFSAGPMGIPPWAPAAVLLVALMASIGIPFAWHRAAPPGDTFWAQAAENRRNSLFLSAAIVLLLALTAYVVAVVVSLRTSVALAVMTAAVFVGAASAVAAYRMGDRALLRLSSARPYNAKDSTLHDVVAEMATAAGIPAPRLFVIEEQAPNAFAAGRDPAHAVLVVTRGLLQAMTREELQGVVAHEMAHIRNYDVRYDLIVAIGVGAVVLVADGFFRVVTFPLRVPRLLLDNAGGGGSGGKWGFGDWGGLDFGGGHDGGGGDSDSDSGKAIAIILAIIIFVLMLLLVATVLNAIAPLFARLTQVAVTRQREYLADSTAVELGRNPTALESALLKCARSPRTLQAANRATAPLWFVNPIRAFEDRANSIFATHPPTIDRVNRLRALQGLAPIQDTRIYEDVA
jgi:heat shock protein HtpX